MLGPWGEKGRYLLGIWYSFKEDLRDGLLHFPDTVEAEIGSRTLDGLGIRPPLSLCPSLPFPCLFLLPPHSRHQLCARPGSLPAGSNLCCHVKEQHLIFASLSSLTSLPGVGQSPWHCQCSIPSPPRHGMNLSFMACLVHSLVQEHNYFEVCIWSKWPAGLWLAKNQSGNNWKRIVFPPYLCSVFTNLNIDFLPPFCQASLTLL